MPVSLPDAIRYCKMSLTNLHGITRRSWDAVLEAAERELNRELNSNELSCEIGKQQKDNLTINNKTKE